MLAALLSGANLPEAFRPKQASHPIGGGRPRPSHAGARFYRIGDTIRRNPTTLLRREWRAATKAERRALKKKARWERAR